MSPITKEEWQDWKRNKVTQEYFRRVVDQREQYKEGLVEGHAENHQERDIVIGRCQGIKDCIDYAISGFTVINPTAEETTND